MLARMREKEDERPLIPRIIKPVLGRQPICLCEEFGRRARIWMTDYVDLKIPGNADLSTNCLGHALGVPAPVWFHVNPSGRDPKNNPKKQTRAVLSDMERHGFEPVCENRLNPDTDHIIGCVGDGVFIHHFGVLHQNGLWTHKWGKTPVSHLDINGHPVTDFKAANLAPLIPYPGISVHAFMGYYRVPERGIQCLL